MDTLLAAVNLDHTSNGFLAYVEHLCLQLGAKLWLVHVCQPHPDVVELPASAESWVEVRLLAEHQPLVDWASSFQTRGIDARPVLLQGPVVETVLEVAQEVAASMILVNSRGHGPLYDMLVGSVAEGVAGGASCPVLWVPAAWVDR